MQHPLRIATAVNGAYLLPLKVMLISLIEHLHTSYRPVVYLLNTSLTVEQLESVRSLAEAHSVVPDATIFGRLPQQPGFQRETAFPLLLPELLPDSVDRVLFLDPDVLVFDDVSKIWTTDLSKYGVAAAADQAVPYCSSHRGVKGWRGLGIPAEAPYFNAGVMLINIAHWRRFNIADRAREYLQHLSVPSDFLHQEALNAVLWNSWLQLDQRWNLVASLTGRRYGPFRDMSWADPGMVHFAGRFKPWRIRIGGPFAEPYNRLLAQSFRGEYRQNKSLSENVLSIYDRYLRDYLYVCERILWNNRMI